MPTMKGVRNAPGAGTRERCHCGDGGHRHCDEARLGATETCTGFKPLGETIENAIDHQQDRCDTQIGHGQRAVADQHLHVDEWLLSAQEVKDQHDSEDGQQARPAKWDGRDSSGTTLSSAESREQCDANQIEFFHQGGEPTSRLLVFGNPQKKEEDGEQREGKVHRENRVPPEVSGQNTAKDRPDGSRRDPGKRHNAHGDTRRFRTNTVCLPAENADRRRIGPRGPYSEQNTDSDQHA